MSTTNRLALSLALLAASSVSQAEIPYLEARVQAGELAPMAERLPQNPRQLDFSNGREIGEYGGQLRLIMAKAKDTRQMAVYGYARLVAYNQDLKLVPDILESIEIEDNRRFTLHLRKGHKWSDGHPFTSEDFRYYWEDVANNDELSPFGPPPVLKVDGEPPEIEFIDETTVRYTWQSANPNFVTALAGARPTYIYRPAHYLKRYHPKYADPEKLKALLKKTRMKTWTKLHTRNGHLYKMDNPKLPTLQPWYVITKAPSDRFVFKRNPYFHRVDPEGNQLPYVDEVVLSIVSSSLVPAKTGAGDSDLQARYLRMDNYTFLKAGEKDNGFSVNLWSTAAGSRMALYPNLNNEDAAWRELFRNPDFRRALSLGVDRNQINEVVYFGLVIEGNNTVLPQSPLFKDDYQKRWAVHDPERANQLLDALGLDKRNGKGIRLMADGRPVEIIVQTAGESTEETDVLELIHDDWMQIGVKLYSKPSQREVFRNRVFSGQAQMAVWQGLSNGVPTADMSPDELAPTSQTQLQWPKWGQFFETASNKGEAPDIPEAVQLAKLNEAWTDATSDEAREKIWHSMLEIHAEQVFTIGTVCGVGQPVVVNKALHNVPTDGLYNWNPGAFFGIYQMDSFWFDKSRH